MSELLITPELEEGDKVLINPLIDPSTLLEKARRRIVYNPRLRRYHEVMPKTYVLPVYLPELGVLLSLDTVSKNLARKIYEETKDYEGIISKGKVFLCTTHHFQREINRMVSWGTIKSVDLVNNILRLYIADLINDFYLTPSIIRGSSITSPHRWFFISSIGYHKFEAFLNYNFGVVYIEKEKLYQRKIKKVWINSPLKLYQVIGGFVSFRPTGFVEIKHVPLHFTADPTETDIVFQNKGDYFVCFLISFNRYSTSYDFASIKSGNINLVESLAELVHSPYEILPFLFPFAIENETIESLIYRFIIKKDVFRKIYSRITKFSTPQSSALIEGFESFIREQNILLSITEQVDLYYVEVANPVVIPFLIKKIADENNVRIKYSATKILKEPRILEKIRYLNDLLNKKQWYNTEFLPLHGIGRVLIPRADVLRKYIRIYKDLTSIQQKS